MALSTNRFHAQRLSASVISNSTAKRDRVSRFTRFLLRLWNRGLPPHVSITHKVVWPLFLLPFALFSQIVTPHPVWIVLCIVLSGIYGFGFFWVRSQAQSIQFKRKRVGTVLLAGDALREEFELQNEGVLTVLWAEFIDHSTLPGYNPGRVVACTPTSSYRWNTSVICPQRGIYQLGPHELSLGDPLGLFRLDIRFDYTEVILIYPRVAHLPSHVLPHGDASGAARQRRPLRGTLPSASVRNYQATDSLRYVHWPLTAHHSELMVKEMEIEPSGAVWIVLDLNEAAHSGKDETSTLEFGVILAASLAAELLIGGERRAVGLLTVSGKHPGVDAFATNPDGAEVAPDVDLQSALADSPWAQQPPVVMSSAKQAVLVASQSGQAQLWRILGALAAVQATDVTLAELLRSSGTRIGRRGTVIVITPQLYNIAGADDWTAELLHLQALGATSSVLLVTSATASDGVGGQLGGLLAQHDIPLQTWRAGTRLPAALTFRRTRKIVRNTPTGGAVTYEVDEDVG